MKNKLSPLALFLLFALGNIGGGSAFASTLDLKTLQEINQTKKLDVKESSLKLQPLQEMNVDLIKMLDILRTKQVARQHIDYNLSVKVFDNYIDFLDPNRFFLTAQDISFLKGIYATQDKKTNIILSNKVDSAFDIYKFFALRKVEVYKAIIAWINTLKTEPNLNLNKIFYRGKGNSPVSNSFDELVERNKENVLVTIIEDKLDNDNYKFSDIKKDLLSSYKNKLSEAQSYSNIFVINDEFLRAVGAAGDHYTHLLGFESSATYRDPETGKGIVVGLGYKLNAAGDVQVLSLTKGGPLEATGKVAKGDIVFAISQKDNKNYTYLGGKSLDEISSLFKGPKGSVLYLKVKDVKTKKDKEVKVVRNSIKKDSAFIPSVEYFPDGRGGDIAQISFPGFETGVADQIGKIINSNSKISSIILDLRDNGGGSVLEAYKITNMLNAKKVLSYHYSIPGKGQGTSFTNPDKAYTLFAGPLLVLINRHSASASELVSTSIQDSKRAYIVGSTSFGKGIAQAVGGDPEELVSTNHGQFKRTVFYFQHADGRSVQNVGTIPEFKLPETYNPKVQGMEHGFNPPPKYNTPRGRYSVYENYVTPEITKDLSSALEDYIKENQTVYNLWEEYAKATAEDAIEELQVKLNYEERLKRQKYFDELYLKRVNAQQKLAGEKQYAKKADIPKDYELKDINLEATIALMKRYIPHLAKQDLFTYDQIK